VSSYDRTLGAWPFVLMDGPGQGVPLDLWLAADTEPPPLVVYTWWCHDRFAQALYVYYGEDVARGVICYAWVAPVGLDPRIALEEAACPDAVSPAALASV
jgi:hypothetical protein